MKTDLSDYNKAVSIIVPVLNEEENVILLAKNIDTAIKKIKYLYEIIFIDDHSTDNTEAVIQNISQKYPVRYYKKEGKQGKAQSLLEGFSKAKYELICMIDADLQYPPEAIPDMLKKIEEGNDVIVANRKELKTNKKRIIFSKAFNFIFCKLLHGLNFDVQSGLKLFKKEIIKRIQLKPLPWTFDLEFLILARAAGYKISSVDIIFEQRKSGESKIQLFDASLQIGLSALILKFQSHPIIPFHEEKMKKVGQGFHYKKVEFVHFSDLHFAESAVKTLLGHQKLFLFSVILLFTAGLLFNWIITLTAFVSIITVIYFCDLLFNFYLIFRSFTRLPEIQVSQEEIDKVKEWPMYTIFCPLYKEWSVVEQFVKAIDQLDYPKNKLQVQLLLEEDDTETIAHIKSSILPHYFQIVVVPNTLPKTKPKACNYGLRYAKGEYAVIYDAEDIPDPLQLKKAVLAFQKSDSKIACIQAKLNYYNTKQNLLTRLFTAEYSLWFDLILTGLQSINAPIPLGGTSNHFKVSRLKEVKGWDSFNVTEDCDLGIRLAKRGYRTAIVDSLTMEEGNSHLGNWLNQRSRWIKGYMQTYLVHMRYPHILLSENFKAHFATFQLVVGGKIASLFINPFMWLTTIAYFTLRVQLGPTIEQFFPGPIFYMGVFSLIFGNFLYMYYYMIACAKRQQFDLIKYVFLIPLYWLAMSIAAWKGLFQLIFKPHYWPKTRHGLHLKKTQQPLAVVEEKKLFDWQKVTGVITVPLTSIQNIIRKINQSDNKTWSLRTLSSSGILIIALVANNFLNFMFNTYFGRVLPYEDFGLLTLVNTITFLITIFFISLTTTINHKVAYLSNKDHSVKGAAFVKETYKRVISIILISSFIWAALTPMIMKYFHLQSYFPVLVMVAVIIFGVMSAINEGYLKGSFNFISLGLVVISVPVVKILMGIYFQITHEETLVYLSIPISIILPVVLSSLIVWNKIKNIKDNSSHYEFPFTFYLSSILSTLSVSAYITIDILLVQHYLPSESGKYALLSLAGKIIYFLGSLINTFIVSFVSRDLGNHTSPRRTFNRIFTLTFLLTVLSFTGIGVFGKYTLPFLFGEKISAVTPYLLIYCMAIAYITLSSTILAYHLARKHYSFPIFALISTTFLFIGISNYHSSIQQITLVMLITSAIHLIGMIGLHFIQENGQFFTRNIVDFFSLFIPIQTHTPEKGKKRILIFNWRDIRHSFAGGAEVYIHELSKRWVEEGHEVLLFCGNDGNCKRNEVIDGVRIIRRGGFYMVYLWAFLYYLLRFRGRFDIIIDAENGIPFFTPLYAKEKIYLLIHHIHQEVFRNSLISPLAAFATFLEIKVMPYVYKNVDIITVSNSSKEEIMKAEISSKEPIVVHNGVDITKYTPGHKHAVPLIVYIGRLKKYKSIHIFLYAAQKILETVKNAQFIIAGDGEEKMNLQLLTKKLGLQDKVLFLGKVSEEEKVKLFQQAWIFVQPSMMEGWSLTTIEANACGTPVVASLVPGLKDAVRNPHTGYLVEYGNIDAFTEKIRELISNNNIRKNMSYHSVNWAHKFSWDVSANKLLSLFTKKHE